MATRQAVKALQKQVQERYATWLTELRVDVIAVDAEGVMFGYAAEGGTDYIRFDPAGRGMVVVQTGTYFERYDQTLWSDPIQAPCPLEEVMLDEFDAEPSVKASRPKKSYRRY